MTSSCPPPRCVAHVQIMCLAWVGVLQVHSQSSAALLCTDQLLQTSHQIPASCCVYLLRLQMFKDLAPQMLALGARNHSRPAQTQLRSSRLLLQWAAPSMAFCLKSSVPPAALSCTTSAICPMPSRCPSGMPGSACHPLDCIPWAGLYLLCLRLPAVDLQGWLALQ